MYMHMYLNDSSLPFSLLQPLKSSILYLKAQKGTQFGLTLPGRPLLGLSYLAAKNCSDKQFISTLNFTNVHFVWLQSSRSLPSLGFKQTVKARVNMALDIVVDLLNCPQSCTAWMLGDKTIVLPRGVLYPFKHLSHLWPKCMTMLWHSIVVTSFPL